MLSMYDKKKFFETYIESASEKNEFINRLTMRFRSAGRNYRKVLDLGCHNGFLVLKFINRNHDRLSKGAKIYCVDPSVAAISEFKSKKLPSDLEFFFFTNTMEEFLETSEISYDWIICSHCLYWSKDLLKIVSKIVKRGQHIVIVLRGEKGIYEIQSHFKNLLGNDRENLYVSNHIEMALRKLSVKFDREDIISTINVPQFEDPEFKALAAFFLQTDTKCLNNSDYKRIYEFINQRGNPFPHYVSFFWIRSK